MDIRNDEGALNEYLSSLSVPVLVCAPTREVEIMSKGTDLQRGADGRLQFRCIYEVDGVWGMAKDSHELNGYHSPFLSLFLFDSGLCDRSDFPVDLQTLQIRLTTTTGERDRFRIWFGAEHADRNPYAQQTVVVQPCESQEFDSVMAVVQTAVATGLMAVVQNFDSVNSKEFTITL